VIAGASPAASQVSLSDAADEVEVTVAAGSTRSDAITAVAARLGIRRRELYDAVVNPQRR
jgi:16S rRNA (cytidine1402-2'-O)-methyltransferase